MSGDQGRPTARAGATAGEHRPAPPRAGSPSRARRAPALPHGGPRRSVTDALHVAAGRNRATTGPRTTSPDSRDHLTALGHRHDRRRRRDPRPRRRSRPLGVAPRAGTGAPRGPHRPSAPGRSRSRASRTRPSVRRRARAAQRQLGGGRAALAVRRRHPMPSNDRTWSNSGPQQLLAEASGQQLEQQAGQPGPRGRTDGVLRGGDAALVVAVHESPPSGRGRECGSSSARRPVDREHSSPTRRARRRVG